MPHLRNIFLKSLLLAFTLLLAACSREGGFTVNTLISEGAVLQQRSKVVIGGYADPGTRIAVKTDWDFSVTTSGNADSTWSVTLSTPAADCLSHTITLTGDTQTVVINDVLIGEVWVASGQSNMGMPLVGWGADSVMGGKQLQAEAKDNLMRFFCASQQHDFEKMKNLSGNWKSLAPENSTRFSAVAYSFAKTLRDSLQIPIGIVQTPFGGATCRSWVSPEHIKEDPLYKGMAAELARDKKASELYSKWLNSFPSQPVKGPRGQDLLKDMSVYDEYINLSVPDFSHWPKMNLPGYWENHNLPGLNGVVWFMKKVQIPENWIGRNLRLVLGCVDDRDLTYVNQVLIGYDQGSESFNTPREYDIPASIVSGHSLTLAVRVTDERANGGITGCKDGSKMRIELADNPEENVSIEGEWAYRVGAQIYNGRIYFFGMPDNKFTQRPYGNLSVSASLATVSYNGMVAPMKGFPVAGVLWHQGEADIWKKSNRLFVGKCLDLIVRSFRDVFENKNLPFLVAQISPGLYHGCQGVSSGVVRDLLLESVLSMDDNVKIISTLDLGSLTTLRAPFKFEEGRRFARVALSHVYGRQGFIPNGPIPLSATTGHSIINIQVENADGLYVDTDKPSPYEIAGADSVFYPARAMAGPSGLSVFSHMVSEPVYVRYAHGNCAEPNTWNSIGIPLPSFSFVADEVD